MNSRVVVVGLVAAGLLGSAELAMADGVMFPDAKSFAAYRERAFIHEPQQKAILFYRNGTEDLIISPSFSGPAERFAWVIPVPARPKVDKVEGAIFHEIVSLVHRPAPGHKAKMQGTERAAGHAVEVLERKPVGAYDVAVLRASDPQALTRWLNVNGFAITPAARKPVAEHIKEGWTFVAMRVRVPKQAAGLKTGTLAPIRLTFRTQEPVYPLRVSGANPGPFQVDVYLVVPYRNDPRARVVNLFTPEVKGRPTPLWSSWSGTPSKETAPTLARLAGGPCAIYTLIRHYQPAQCTADIRFGLSPLLTAKR